MSEKPPSPFNERRFQPPVNKEAQELLASFRKAVTALQEKYPEVLGATLYGSLIKGEQANPESDIDGSLYINPDVIADAPFDKEKYAKLLQEELGFDDATFEARCHDVEIVPMSTEIINQYIRAADAAYATHPNDIKYVENSSVREQNMKIAEIFHAFIGERAQNKGLDMYRKHFLKQIASLPEAQRDFLWAQIIRAISWFEERRGKNIQIELPVTFAHACRRYYPELLKGPQL